MNSKNKSGEISFIEGENSVFNLHPADIITFDPISFIVPFIFAYIAYLYYQRNIIISIGLIIVAIGFFIYYYLVFKNTSYTITNRRIISYNGLLKKMRGMPISAVDNVGFKQSLIPGKSRSIVIKDKKGNSLEIKGIREWKEVTEFIMKGKYGENLIINF
jgi:hypothetical protein